MEILIITGLSGAGKSRASNVLEDLGYYCVDNLPVGMMVRFAEFCIAAAGRYEKVALVSDVRAKTDIARLPETIDQLRGMNCVCRILFIEADTATLIRRYKESRRPHPLAKPGESIEQSVARETALLAPVRESADFVLDSSNLTLGMLQNNLYSLFGDSEKKRDIAVTVESFGFKHGIPMDADLVFDVRFMPNPFYVERLRPMSGLDRAVAEYVFSHSQARDFLVKLEDMLDFLLPNYVEEGKLSLTIAIGCTGGRHRSVAIAAALNAYLVAKGVNSLNINRDIDK